MRFEIERKFLVRDTGWREQATRRREFRDGLIGRFERGKVRVRVEGDRAWLTVKGARRGISRSEFEYEIPGADGLAMLAETCQGCIIEKTRHCVPFEGLVWSVDEFKGPLAGIVVAEIELDAEDQVFTGPPWLRQEVTGDPRFSQAHLLRLCETSSAPLTVDGLLAMAKPA